MSSAFIPISIALKISCLGLMIDLTEGAKKWN